MFPSEKIEILQQLIDSGLISKETAAMLFDTINGKINIEIDSSIPEGEALIIGRTNIVRISGIDYKKISAKCECGAEKIGVNNHSIWCPKV